MFGNEVTATQYSSEELFEFEIPIVISAPEEIFSLNDIFLGGDLQTIASDIAEILETVLGWLIPDVITVDVLGIPDGLTILTAGADISLWQVSLSEAAFNAIASTEGSTVEVSFDLLDLLKITLIISAIPS
ncbi:MAG: hypothetical protein LIP08_06120 [Bacteroides sp.]|nr:hypothetical protein [Bacteroides sp.]